MNEYQAVDKIKQFFNERNDSFIYTNGHGKSVLCHRLSDGVTADCLNDTGYKEFLPWGVFWQAVHIIIKNGGTAIRGEAMGAKLGEPKLPFSSVEGGLPMLFMESGLGILCSEE